MIGMVGCQYRMESQRVEAHITADFAVSTKFFNLLAFQVYLELGVQISHGFRTSWLLCLASSFLVSGCYKADNKLTLLDIICEFSNNNICKFQILSEHRVQGLFATVFTLSRATVPSRKNAKHFYHFLRGCAVF